MSRSDLPRSVRTRRGAATAALVVALPFTMAAGCQDEGAVEPGVEQEEGVEQEMEQDLEQDVQEEDAQED